jgi:hypothetical protein
LHDEIFLPFFHSHGYFPNISSIAPSDSNSYVIGLCRALSFCNALANDLTCLGRYNLNGYFEGIAKVQFRFPLSPKFTTTVWSSAQALAEEGLHTLFSGSSLLWFLMCDAL